MEYAHSVEKENELRSIALYGLCADSSIELASAKAYAVGTIRIIFGGQPTGKTVNRAFAADMPFIKISQPYGPDKIKRVEVDTGNLQRPPKTEDEFAAWYDELIAKYGSETRIPRSISKAVERELDRFGDTTINTANWRDKIKEALSGTKAENVPVIAINL